MAPTPASPQVKVRVWDAPTRLGHWLFVLLIAVSWWTAQNGHLQWHRYSGYTILGVLIFRLYWGFAGGGTAQFRNFVRGPPAVWTYARSLTAKPSGLVIGLNPMGAWSVLAMIAAMIGQVGLGLFSVDTDGLESGPLSSYVSFDFGRACARLHGKLFDVLLVLIAVHLAAILFYLAYKRENLITPMLTGYRRTAAQPAPAEPPRAPVWRLVLGLVLAAGLAWFVSRGLKL